MRPASGVANAALAGLSHEALVSTVRDVVDHRPFYDLSLADSDWDDDWD
ncbi:hypothetical protein [Frondihabitans cladoniiphilus]|uniref:Uncharacterized protein n=1 Tax=Frondihabitans cladoniiphilus TaxID=715785 RepID=A0ABP8VXL1_9MICO